MAKEWHKYISFTARFTALTQLLNAIQAASSLGSAQASASAQELETKVFEESTSVEEYHARLRALVAELSSDVATEEEPEWETADQIATRLLDRPGGKTKIGRYVEAARFGAGLFSVVYIARQEKKLEGPQGYIALKATNLSAVQPPHDAQREARILNRAKSEHVIPVLEHFYDAAGHLVLVMPFMPLNLEQLLAHAASRRESASSLPNESSTNSVSLYSMPVNIKGALRDLFAALAFIHPQGIIHRDIKPSNMLLRRPSGPAYLSDFSISWCASDGASESADLKITDVGTTCYRAPEVLFGDRTYGTAFDMWAAGCVAAEAVMGAGKSLFDGGSVGSELRLVMSIFETLGTPDERTWPELSRIPDWGKMNFREMNGKGWEKIMPGVHTAGRDLVAGLVRYSASERLTAEQALNHEFFKTLD